jgi:hypothetical protein
VYSYFSHRLKALLFPHLNRIVNFRLIFVEPGALKVEIHYSQAQDRPNYTLLILQLEPDDPSRIADYKVDGSLLGVSGLIDLA